MLRKSVAHIDAQAKPVDVHMVGKKGVGYFRFLGRPLAERITHLADDVRYAEIEPLANALMEQFIKGEIGAVYVAYMAFESASRQVPTLLQLLPLAPPPTAKPDGSAGTAAKGVEYEFSPEPGEAARRAFAGERAMRLFQCFAEAVVSEQVARMVAMKAATDAAGDMIKSLTRRYNRARQTHITMELLDIIGGASALG